MYSVLDGLGGVGVVQGVQRLHTRSVRCALCVQCAGGLGDGLGVRECAWKECEEEASIDEELLEDLKSVGVVRCVFLPLCEQYCTSLTKLKCCTKMTRFLEDHLFVVCNVWCVCCLYKL